MRVLVCGGRDFVDNDLLCRTLDEMDPSPTLLIEGGARGADGMAFAWASRHGVERRTYPANWAKYGKAAGFVRNQAMLDRGKPDVVIAFPGGRGTADMAGRAERAGVEVRRINWPLVDTL